MKIKKVDFKQVKVELKFEGEPEIMDLRKVLGNELKSKTIDIGEEEIARKIYFSDHECELTQQECDQIISLLDRISFIYPVKSALINLLTSK